MDLGLLEAESSALRDVRAAEDEKVISQMRIVLASIRPTTRPDERRRDQRYPYARLVVLTAVANDGVTPLEETYVVVGKQISERGIGFFHPKPLPCRRVIASMELESGRWISLLLSLRWCRFTRHNWYESGGRFLQVADTPPSVYHAAPSE